MSEDTDDVVVQGDIGERMHVEEGEGEEKIQQSAEMN